MKAGFQRAGRALARLYPMGISLFWKAPLVVALVVVPEFLQHVAEIHLGMFGTREQTIAAAGSPTRMAFGYTKVAGLILAILAAARVWGARDKGVAWYRLSDIVWGRFALGFLLFILLPIVPGLFVAHIGKSTASITGIVLTILLLPAMFLMLAGLFGDRATTTRAMWRQSWPWALLSLLLLLLAFAPAQWLHGMNHKWAMGADPALVWALMIFDSLLVGLLAGLTGTALYLGYAAFRVTVSPNLNQDPLPTDE